MLNTETKSLETRVRRLADQYGYRVSKSRAWKNVPNYDNCGEYTVIDNETNGTVFGHRYDASLTEIEEFLRADAA